MFVTLDVNGQLVTVPYETSVNSELIKERVDSVGVECIISFPTNTKTDVAWNYVKFLMNSSQENQDSNSSSSQQETVDDVDKLKMCFVMETYFVDVKYFKYLMQQVFNNWFTYYKPVIIGEPNPDIQRRMLLLCPYEFVPETYMMRPLFFKQWLKCNSEVKITLNHKSTLTNHEFKSQMLPSSNGNTISNGSSSNGSSEVYYNDIVYDNDKMSYLIVYHTVDDNRVGINRQIKFYPSGAIQYQKQYLNDNNHGVWRWWYDNEQHTLQSESEYCNGQEQGVRRWWYDTQREINEQYTVKSEVEYVNNKKHGSCKEWYDNDNHTLKWETYYDNGNQHGLSIKWYNNKQHTVKERGKYHNDKKHGM